MYVYNSCLSIYCITRCSIYLSDIHVIQRFICVVSVVRILCMYTIVYYSLLYYMGLSENVGLIFPMK